MKTKIIALLMVVIVVASMISGCVEKTIPAKAVNTNVTTVAKLSSNSNMVKIPESKNEAMPATVVIAPPSQPEQKIPASEEPKLTIISPENVSSGEDFTVTLALEPQANKIVAVEASIISDDKIKIISSEIISTNPETDKIVQGGDISYADTGGITGEFATIKFSANQKGQAEITVKAIVVDKNQLTAELVSKKIINIV